nr:CidA/LrgA family holin-like protein [Bacillus subtilis]
MKKLLLTVIQIALLFIFARLINWVTALLHINIPRSSIIGIVILFTLLHFNIIKLEWIELGATWLLGELLLFFIPSAVGVIEYGDIMSKFGVSILLVVIISTFVVMVSTGTLTQLIAKRKEKKHTCSSEL